MIILWMAYALIVAALLAIAGRSAEEVMRARRLPARWVWIAAIGLAIGLPAVAGARSGGWLGFAGAAAVEGQVVVDRVTVRDPAAPIADAAGSEGSRSWIDAWPPRVAAVVGVERLHALHGTTSSAWAVATAVLLSILAWTARRARSVRSRWPERRVFGETVRVAPEFGPAVQGIVRPEIILPEWLLSGPEPEIRLAVAHEREHLRAGDPQTLLAGWIAVALLPWNPVIWWMYSRLRLAVEIDCDRRVLAGGAGRVAYGSMLVDVASRRPLAGLPGAAGLVGGTSHLERRIRAMTLKTRHARTRAGVFGALAVLALVAACDTRVPTAAEIEAMDLASVESRATELLGPATADAPVTYVVDGVIVDRETANRIDAERIESVEVTRGAVAPHADGQSVESRAIIVRTRPGEAGAPAEDVVNMGFAATPAESGVRPEMTGPRPRIIVDGVPIDEDLPPVASGQIPAEVARGGADQTPGQLRSDMVRLRGVQPSTSGGGPMIIVDGVIVSRSLDVSSLDIESMDIESIEVIKGQAAERLYGARGANGVISVETRAADPSPQ